MVEFGLLVSRLTTQGSTLEKKQQAQWIESLLSLYCCISRTCSRLSSPSLVSNDGSEITTFGSVIFSEPRPCITRQVGPPCLRGLNVGAAWPLAEVVRFYRQHGEIIQDLEKKKTRGISSKRFAEHCEAIPEGIRGSYNIKVFSTKNGRQQASMCKRISRALDAVMNFWGNKYE